MGFAEPATIVDEPLRANYDRQFCRRCGVVHGMSVQDANEGVFMANIL
jgi:hypothetical protein